MAGGTSRLKADDQNATVHRQPIKANDSRVNRHVLAGHSNPTAPNATVFNQPGGNELGRVAGDGKANSLCGKNDGCVNADDFSARVNQRSARVAGIQGRIGLNDIIDEPPGLGAHGPAQGAHDTGSDSLMESKGTSDRDGNMADPHRP